MIEFSVFMGLSSVPFIYFLLKGVRSMLLARDMSADPERRPAAAYQANLATYKLTITGLIALFSLILGSHILLPVAVTESVPYIVVTLGLYAAFWVVPLHVTRRSSVLFGDGWFIGSSVFTAIVGPLATMVVVGSLAYVVFTVFAPQPLSFSYDSAEFSPLVEVVEPGGDLVFAFSGYSENTAAITDLVLTVSCNGNSYRRAIVPPAPNGLSSVPNAGLREPGPFDLTFAVTIPDDAPRGAECVYTHAAHQCGNSFVSVFQVRFRTAP